MATMKESLSRREEKTVSPEAKLTELTPTSALIFSWPFALALSAFGASTFLMRLDHPHGLASEHHVQGVPLYLLSVTALNGLAAMFSIAVPSILLLLYRRYSRGPLLPIIIAAFFAPSFLLLSLATADAMAVHKVPDDADYGSAIYILFMLSAAVSWGGFLACASSMFRARASAESLRHPVPHVFAFGILTVATLTLAYLAWRRVEDLRTYLIFLLAVFAGLLLVYRFRPVLRGRWMVRLFIFVCAIFPVCIYGLWLWNYGLVRDDLPLVLNPLFLGLLITLIIAASGMAPVRWLYVGVAPALVLLLVSAPLFLLNFGTAPGSSPERPHVLLIVIDTLRYDMLSFASPDAPSTPHLDKFAADHFVFQRAYASGSWTLPSMVSMFSGVSAAVHQATNKRSSIPPALPNIVADAKDAGYVTGAVVSNAVLAPGRGIELDFDEYLYPLNQKHTWASLFLHDVFPGLFPIHDSTEALVAHAARWFSVSHGHPTFYWLHILDPHLPYEPPEEWRPNLIGGDDEESRRYDRKQLYKAEVQYVDAELGKLFDHLRHLGLYDSMMIIVTSDHGEEFWEHGEYEHGHSSYDEVLRVPLMMKLPGQKEGGVIQRTVANASLAATIADVLEIDPFLEFRFPSLVPLLEEATPSANIKDSEYVEPVEPIFLSGHLYVPDEQVLLFDQYKLIRKPESQDLELFNLVEDPFERNDLSNERPAVVEKGLRLLGDYLEEAQAWRYKLELDATEDIEFSPEQVEQLRDIGYIE